MHIYYVRFNRIYDLASKSLKIIFLGLQSILMLSLEKQSTMKIAVLTKNPWKL